MLNSQLKINRYVKTLLLSFIIVFLISKANANANVEINTLIKSGIENNLELKLLQSELDEIDLTFKSSRSLFLPKVGIEARYELFEANQSRENGGSGNLFLEWNLLNGFKDYSYQKSLSFSKKNKNFEKERLEEGLALKIKKSYSKVVSYTQILETFKIFFDKNQKIIKSIKLRQSSGLVTSSDLLEFELFESKLKLDYISVEFELKSELKILSLLTGVENLPTLTKQLGVESFEKSKINIESLLVDNRSFLQEDITRLNDLSQQKHWSKFRYLPQISFMATHGSLGLRETVDKPETALGLVARWEIFSGFETQNESKLLDLKMYQSGLVQSFKRNTFESELGQLILKLENLQNQIEYEENNFKRVEKYLSLILGEYKNGVRNAADVKAALELALDSSINRSKLVPEYFNIRENIFTLLGYDVLVPKN